MKKILTILFLFVFSSPAFGDYTQNTTDKQTQLKKPIELLSLQERTDLSIDKINQYLNYQKEIYLEGVKEKYKNTDSSSCTYFIHKNKRICIKSNKKIAFNLPLSEYDYVGRFIEGRGIVLKKIKEIKNDNNGIDQSYNLVKLSIIDINNNIIKSFDTPVLYIVYDGESIAEYSPQFYRGYAKIDFVINKDISKITKLSQVKTQTLYIDKMGNIVDKNIIPKYTYNMLNNKEFAKLRFLPDLDIIPKAMRCENNSNEICYAYINDKNKIKIKPIIDGTLTSCGEWYARNPFFYKGRAMASSWNQEVGTFYFYINKKGEKINDNIYLDAEPFYDNFAIVQLLDKRYVLIDINGNIVWNDDFQKK